MVRRMLTGNAAAAWGARLANVDYVPAFPITPQTEIVETLAKWYADHGRHQIYAGGHSVDLPSTEHSLYVDPEALAAGRQTDRR